MSSFPLYVTTHVNLACQRTMPLLTQADKGNYVVFWWHEIALGHVFFEPAHPLNETAYYQALLTAIAPAIEQATADKPAAHDPWQTWLTQGELGRWEAWLAVVLADFLPLEIPPQVPVSVIICTRNRAPQLRRCLMLLRALTCAPAEIVVVDNAPSNTTTHDVCQEFTNVVYLLESRPGLDFARNTGIKATRYPIVAFVDDDVLVHPWLLYRVWETFQDPSVAAMTGLVISMALQSEAQIYFERYWSFNRGYITKRYDTAFLQARPAPPVWEIGAGANMAFRKAVFEEVGYFNELLGAGVAGCGDDSEMWYRILWHGHAIQYNPHAIVHHEHRKEMAALKYQLFSYMRGHVVAALIQHAQQPQAGYARYIYRNLPIYYLLLIKIGFPFFRFRNRTLWSEIKGIVSGIAFYYRRCRPTSPKCIF